MFQGTLGAEGTKQVESRVLPSHILGCPCPAPHPSPDLESDTSDTRVLSVKQFSQT